MVTLYLHNIWAFSGNFVALYWVDKIALPHSVKVRLETANRSCHDNLGDEDKAFELFEDLNTQVRTILGHTGVQFKGKRLNPEMLLMACSSTFIDDNNPSKANWHLCEMRMEERNMFF